jgi:hypothetical protein
MSSRPSMWRRELAVWSSAPVPSSDGGRPVRTYISTSSKPRPSPPPPPPAPFLLSRIWVLEGVDEGMPLCHEMQLLALPVIGAKGGG